MDSKVIILVIRERSMYCLHSFRNHFLGPANTLICVSNMQMARAMGNPVPTVESSGWIFAHDMDSLYISFFVWLVLGRWMDGYTAWFKNIVGINMSQTSQSGQFRMCSEIFLQLNRSIEGNLDLFSSERLHLRSAISISMPKQSAMMQWRAKLRCIVADSKVHGASMGPTWVLSAPDGPHVGPMSLAIRSVIRARRTWNLCQFSNCPYVTQCYILPVEGRKINW